eukprot:tig00020903_g15123.t1
MAGDGLSHLRTARVHAAPAAAAAPASAKSAAEDDDGRSESMASRAPSRVDLRQPPSRLSPSGPPLRLLPHTASGRESSTGRGGADAAGGLGKIDLAPASPTPAEGGQPPPGPGPPRRARRAQRGPSSHSLGRKQALASWFSETFASWEKPSFVPRSFPDPAIEHEFQEEWVSERVAGTRYTLAFGAASFVITAALFLAGHYRGLIDFGHTNGEGATDHLAAIMASAALPPVAAIFTIVLGRRAHVGSRRHIQMGISCVLLAIYGSTYYAARTTETIAFLFTRVCALSFVAPLFFGLPYAHSLLVNGSGAALAVAFLVEFLYHGGNVGWDAALAIPTCIASVFFGTSAALRNEHAARRAFLLKRESKLESEILKAKSAHLVSELHAFREITAALDLSSPPAFAVNILGDLFEKLVEEGTQASTRHAEVVSAAAGEPGGAAQALVEAGPPAARSSDADEVEALQDLDLGLHGAGPAAPQLRLERPLPGPPPKGTPALSAGGTCSTPSLLPPSTLLCPSVPSFGSFRWGGATASGSGSGSPVPGPSASGALLPRAATFADAPSAELAKVAEAAVSDAWDDFDAFTLERHAGGRPLEFLATEVGRRTSILQANAVDVKKFRTFVASVEGGYKRVPYHSSTHAADVVQAMSWLLHAGGLRAHLRPIDALAALTAAVIHDVNHEGRNNGFEIATQSELAMLYNDQSVLENHSLALSFAALRSPATDFVSHLPKDQRAEFRRVIVGAVLATDMARHFEKVAEFKARVVASTLQTPPDSPGGQSSTGSAGDGETSRRGSAAAQFAPLTAADRGLFIALCLKVADISNAGRSRPQHVEWTSRVSEEFFLQGDEERRLGLPISPYCDRATTLPSAATAGFLSFLALPLLEAWASRFAAARPLVAHARANLAHWKRGEGGRRASAASGAPAPAPPDIGLPPAAASSEGAPGRRLSRAASTAVTSLSTSPTPR